MKHVLILLAASAIGTPAFAQHQGHTMPMPAAKPAPKATKPAPKKAPVKPARAARPKSSGAPAKAAPKTAATVSDLHAGRVMPAQAPPADPHAGHQMLQSGAEEVPPSQADPHSGHSLSQQAPATDSHAGHIMGQGAAPAADPHAGHAMGAMVVDPGAPQEPPPPAALSGPEHAADLFYPDAAMAESREDLREEHGDIRVSRFLFDQLEVGFAKGANAFRWDDAQFWYGGSINKIWFKSQGEGEFGEGLESAEVQALWSHAIDPWFDVQAGVRYDFKHDFKSDPNRGYLVLGLQGLAPYWFEIDTSAFLSNKGDLTFRFEAEYDQRITQYLVLQPRFEFDLALQDVPELDIGSGLSSIELGLRLRYDVYPKSGPAVVAPYVGVEYERAFGDTARFIREEGENVGGWRFLVGVRTWF